MKFFPLYLATLLLLCLAPMPYGYFMLVRFIMLVACSGLAYRYYMLNKKIAMWVFVTLALLFQPIYKVVLGRAIWNAVDVIVAVFFVVLFFVERRLERAKTAAHQQLPHDYKPIIDNKIIFRLEGKLAPKELLYVAAEDDKQQTELFEKNPEVLEGWGKMMGFQIIYLPLLLKRLKRKEVVQYRAPYLSDEELEDVIVGNDFLLQYIDDAADKNKIKQGFIRTEDVYRDSDGKDKVINRFYPLSSNATESIGDQLHSISKQIFEEQNQQGRYLESFDGREMSKGEGKHTDELGYGGKDDTEELLDEVKEKIAQLRQRGISQYILEQLIHVEDKLSRIVITKDYRIVLPDYHDMEIKMEPLVKAIFFLFLKHPEGIIFKHLPDYRQELIDIYKELRPFGMNNRSLQSIEDVTNPFLNSINEKCARIRASFINKFDDHLAKNYYITGERGEAKKITLPRDLVVWE